MIVECGNCATHTETCRDCLAGALAHTPDGIGDLTPGELRALEVFELAGFEVELLSTPEPPVAVPIFRNVA